MEQRQNERDQWADLLRDTKALLPEWDNDDVNRLIRPGPSQRRHGNPGSGMAARQHHTGRA